MTAKNRKLRLQFTQDHRSWTVEDLKTLSGPTGPFLLQCLDGRVRIWCKYPKRLDLSCFLSAVQAVMVWGIFLLHTSDLLIPTDHCLNATALPKYCC